MAEQKQTSTRGRKPKTETTSVKKEQPTVDLQKELDKAKNENNAMAEMLKQMQQQMAEMQSQLQATQNATPSQVVINQNDNLTRTVEVISMIGNTYNLSTQPLGQGKVYTFEKFGEKKSIRFADMQDILMISLPQFEKGYAILTNQKDYEDLGIGYVYDEVLSQEKVENLIALKSKDSVYTILDMEEDIREKIANIIAQRIVEGNAYDYNRIKELEDGGVAINEIVELLQASKE